MEKNPNLIKLDANLVKQALQEQVEVVLIAVTNTLVRIVLSVKVVQ